MSSLTLTRAEAVAVAQGLTLANGDFDIHLDQIQTSEQCHAISRLLHLEATVLDGGDWWIRHGIDATRPDVVDWFARHGKRDCPKQFTITADAAAALAELLPAMVTDANERVAYDLAECGGMAALEKLGEEYPASSLPYKRALDGLAARLGSALPQRPQTEEGTP